MFRIHNKLIREAIPVVRPILIFLIAITVVDSAIAIKGWALPSLLLTGVLVLTGALLIVQVHRTVSYLRFRASMVEEAAARAEEHYVDVLRSIVHFVEARDQFTQGHSDRVARLAEQIGRRLGLPEDRCALLKVAGQLHDIGLLAVPESVLAERARVGIDGFRSIKKHARIAYEVLEPLQSLSDILPGILHHHERMNGTGYPDGIGERDICTEARILAVADSYDAMTHDRPHRPAMNSVAAMEELRRCTPAGYDPVCVEALAASVHIPEMQETLNCAGTS